MNELSAIKKGIHEESLRVSPVDLQNSKGVESNVIAQHSTQIIELAKAELDELNADTASLLFEKTSRIAELEEINADTAWIVTEQTSRITELEHINANSESRVTDLSNTVAQLTKRIDELTEVDRQTQSKLLDLRGARRLLEEINASMASEITELFELNVNSAAQHKTNLDAMRSLFLHSMTLKGATNLELDLLVRLLNLQKKLEKK